MSTGARWQQIEATLVRYDNEVDTCTLHPANPESGKEMTEWITAKEGGYLYLTEWR